MTTLLSATRERLFGLDRRGLLRAPDPARALSTRCHAGQANPRTLGFSGAAAPRMVRAPELAVDAWAFRAAEGFSFAPLPAPDWSRGVTASVLMRMRAVATPQILIASDTGTLRSFSLFNNATGFLRWQVHLGAATYFLQSPQAYAAGRWHWVTGAFGPGELRLAVDGSHFDSAVGPASWTAPASALTIGWKNHAGQNQRLNADVAWFGVWPRPLASAEIRELHRRLEPPRFASRRSAAPFPFPVRRAFPPLAPSSVLA